jgi:hypothetical protein
MRYGEQKYKPLQALKILEMALGMSKWQLLTNSHTIIAATIIGSAYQKIIACL